MTERVLHGYLQKAGKAAEEAKARVLIGADGTIWKRTKGETWRSVGVIRDPELAEDLRVSQLCQQDY